MSLTKDQWNQVRAELDCAGSYGKCVLMINEVRITLMREFISKNKVSIVVYRDGYISLKGCWPKDAEHTPELVSVYRKRSKAAYAEKKKAELIKVFGKREARKVFDIDRVSVWYEPWFPTYGALERQYKKLENVELVSIGYGAKDE